MTPDAVARARRSARNLARRVRGYIRAHVGAGSAGLGDLLRLAYPAGLAASRRISAEDLASAADPFDPTVARRILGGFEQQVGAPRILVRWGPDDVELADVAGSRLALDRADPSISAVIRDGSYEPHVTASLEQLLRPGSTFVDVGANVGYHVVSGAAFVGASGRVVAIEANPENARLLAYTVALNELPQVEVLPIALSSRRGYASFTAMVGSNGGFATLDPEPLTSGRSYIVPTFRLDDLDLERLDVLKVDVEGAEGLVFAGGWGTIDRFRPAIICEFSLEMLPRVSGVAGADFLGEFVDRGYRIAILDRPTRRVTPIVSVPRLLEEWGSLARIEDLLLSPS